MGKGKNACSKHFVLFFHSFQNAFFQGPSKVIIGLPDNKFLDHTKLKHLQMTPVLIKLRFLCWTGLNTLWEKEKTLVTMMFLKSIVKKSRLCTNPFPNNPWFLCVFSTSLLKTLWEKEKLLVTSNFCFSHSVFDPFGELSAIFIKSEIVGCKLCQFGRV